MSSENIALKSTVGSPAVGNDRFFGREKELKSLIEKVIEGGNFYISAPRRIGKTSLMGQAMKDLENDGNMCFSYDLEGKESPSEWIYELAINMYQNASYKKSIEAFIKNITNLGNISTLEAIKSIVNSEQWKSQGRNFFKAFYDSCPEGKKIVIFIDELAVMIQTMQETLPEELRHIKAHEEVSGFLGWFRSIRQSFNTRISFVIASSTGLYPLINRLGLNKDINDIDEFLLEAWEPDTAIECILALARGKNIVISPETAEHMTKIIGWCSPYFVQAFFDSAYENLFNSERISYSDKELSDVYLKYLIRGNKISPTLRNMINRLEKSLPKQKFDLAKQVLNKLAQNDGIAAKSEIKNIKEQTDRDSFNDVLRTLKQDGYIEEKEEEYCFLSKLFRDWWRNEYGD